MKVTLSTDKSNKVRADLLAVPVAGRPSRSEIVAKLDRGSRGRLKDLIRLEKFEGKPGQTLRVALGGVTAKQVVLVGVEPGEPTESSARDYAAAATRAGHKFGSVAILPPAVNDDVIRGLAAGATLGAYRYTEYLTGDRVGRSLTTTKLLIAKRTPELKAAAGQGAAIGESVNHARDLVNAPPNDLNPLTLAAFAKDQCKALGIKCEVTGKKGIEKLGMNLFLAVNRGSGIEPRLIHMTYTPKDTEPAAKVIYVGKGLTFDAGGLCLKPAKSMLDMKCDMAGAAATVGIVLGAARLGLNVEVHGVIGATENMLGADAYRPGDVFRSLDGKSVEIINTDAEGRLVLADVLAYARELGADYMVDHATLTGACMIALGPWRAGLYTDDEELAERYAKAASSGGEDFWRMPLDADLRPSLKSDIADLKHTGDRNGGSITAALFLSEFVGKSRWMHLDIAGPAFQERPKGSNPKGGTGFGVLTGIEFLRELARSATA